MRVATRCAWVLGALVGAEGCYTGVADGTVPDQAQEESGSDGADEHEESIGCADAEPGYVGLQRLTTPQLENTLHDLLGIDVEAPASFPRDDRSGGYISVPQAQLTSSLRVEQQLRWSLALAAEVVNSRAPRVVSCDPASAGCGEMIIEELLPRAFRRPLRVGEREHFLELYATAQGEPQDRLQVVIAAILTAPQFLYRERDTHLPDGPSALSSYDIASRLSYFLWDTMPDDELMALAAAGELTDPVLLEHQVRRMIESPRIERLARSIADQWFELSELWGHALSSPEFDEQLKTSMRDETAAFVSHLLREERPLSELLTASYTFVDARLAELYGVEAPDEGGGLVLAEHEGKEPRRGVLTQAGPLAITSSGDETSIIRRGLWVSNAILCQEVPPPPPGVESDVPDDLPPGATPREVVALHRAKPECAACHQVLDPPGLLLEPYDTLGRYRTRYPEPIDQPIDPSAELADGTVATDVGDLADRVAADPRFVRCAVIRLMPIALGRFVRGNEEVLDEVAAGRTADEMTFAELVVGLATSRAFRCQDGTGEED